MPTDEILTALEIGPGEGKFSNFLEENGVEVTAVDLTRAPSLNEKVHFETMKFENYTPDGIFDLVHARNVMPFFKDKPEQLKRMLLMGKFVYFTFFGPKDPWATKGMSATKEEILDGLEGAKILYMKEEEFEGFTMNKEVKPWHIFTYLVQTS